MRCGAQSKAATSSGSGAESRPAVGPGDLHAEHGELPGDHREFGDRIGRVEGQLRVQGFAHGGSAQMNRRHGVDGNRIEFRNPLLIGGDFEFRNSEKERLPAPVRPHQRVRLHANPRQSPTAAIDDVHADLVGPAQHEIDRPAVVGGPLKGIDRRRALNSRPPLLPFRTPVNDVIEPAPAFTAKT